MEKSPVPRRSPTPMPGRFCQRLGLVFALVSASFPLLCAGQTESPHVPPPAAKVTAGQPLTLADEVIRDVLSNFQTGLETRNLRRVLGVFDAQDMTDYEDFREQMTAFFRLHDNIKFRYQLVQVSADGEIGFAIADVEMDAEPRDTLPTEQRRTSQMRFELKRTPSGWRSIGVKPMDFFSQ